ncbi:MAG: hypothetical protein ACOWWR_13370 [Eubacteriales bacterium]
MNSIQSNKMNLKPFFIFLLASGINIIILLICQSKYADLNTTVKLIMSIGCIFLFYLNNSWQKSKRSQMVKEKLTKIPWNTKDDILFIGLNILVNLAFIFLTFT